ncbi:MAG TPA: hypothetical protein V6C88_14000 [Chroococcidiopsis sp.]
MYWFLTVLLWLIQLICLGLLWASCFPGVLGEIGFIVLLLLFGVFSTLGGLLLILIALGIGLLIWRNRQQQAHSASDRTQLPRRRRYPKRLAIATALTLLVTAVLLWLNLPQVLAFSLSRPAFDKFVANTEQITRLCADPYSEPQVSQQLGLYLVLTCDRDPQGAVYLKTYEDGFFTTENYGFAYRPNPQGSQRFGTVKHDGYKQGPVSGDWYWFMGVRDSF